MKKKLSFLSIVMAIFAFTMLTSCEKEAGPQGPAGADGADGNANVHSQTFTNQGWTDAGSQLQYNCNITDADITQDIVDNGLVQVYISNGTGVWIALPYSWPSGGGTITIFSYSLGHVLVEMAHNDFTPFTNPPGASTFKVVCTEGN